MDGNNGATFTGAGNNYTGITSSTGATQVETAMDAAQNIQVYANLGTLFLDLYQWMEQI